MTKQEFDKLKVGDFIPVKIENTKKYDKCQVMEINRTKETLKHMLSFEHKSYKKFLTNEKELKKQGYIYNAFMGMYSGMDGEYNIVETYKYIKHNKKLPEKMPWIMNFEYKSE